MDSKTFTQILFPAILFNLSLVKKYEFLLVLKLLLHNIWKSVSSNPISIKHSLGVRYLKFIFFGLFDWKSINPELGCLSCFVVIVGTYSVWLLMWMFFSPICILEGVLFGFDSNASLKYSGLL